MYVGALPVAATLLALVILAGMTTSTASAQSSAMAEGSGRAATLPVLVRGAGYQPGGSRAVRELQRLLTRAGYSAGPVDGRYGPATERTVWRFQADRGLSEDGVAGPQTWAALERSGHLLMPGAGYVTGGSAPVRQLQRLLVRAGYAPGPIDGRYGPLTESAVRDFQKGQGLRVDGITGPQTFARLRPITRVHVAPRVHAGPGASPRLPASTAAPRTSHRVVPQASHRAAPSAGVARRATPSGSFPTGWIVLLCALAVVGVVAVALYAHRRRGGRGVRWSKVRRIATAAARRAVAAAERVRAALPARPRRAWRPAKVRQAAPNAEAARDAKVPLAAPTAKAQARSKAAKRQRGEDKAAPGARPAAQTGNGSSGHNGGRPLVFPPPANGNGHHEDARSEAERAFHVGVLLEEQNDLAGAETAYRRADEGGHAAAASNLGVLLEGQGDLVGAKAAYRRAADRGDANGAFNLGVLLEEQLDLVQAQDAYRRADERGHAAAASNLGVLLEGQGDILGAEAAYRRAADRGEANGAFNLGVLLEEREDLSGAESAYRLADQTGEAKVAQMARAALLDLATAANPAGAGRNGGSNGA